jgi:hypothetical protein
MERVALKLPCGHTPPDLPPPGQPYAPDQCYVCWTFQTSPAHNRLWGGNGLPAAPAPAVNLPCVHLGAATGRTVDCPTCADRVSLKLFACAAHGTCTQGKQAPGLACCPCPDFEPDTFRLVAPLGTADQPLRWEGRVAKRPWHWKVTAVVPHLDTVEPLAVVLDLLRLQTEPPYLLVIDTGSPPAVCRELECMRAPDCEVHFVRGHGYLHSSAPVTVAMDLAMALCRTEYLYTTHADVFLRRRDYLEWLLTQCSPSCPAVGYEMSPRSWATQQWRGMVSHTASMLHVPTLRRAGVLWNMEFAYELAGWVGRAANGWPDTETGMNLIMRRAGLRPKIIGPERNYSLHQDANLTHVRSYPGTKAYSPQDPYHAKAAGWMVAALAEARERAVRWRAEFSPTKLEPKEGGG